MHVSGFSTARYATWYYLEQHKLLFDAGDGVAAALGSKCRRVQHVFLSHADRDHIGGLLQLNQLAANVESPVHYYYPKDSGSFPAFRGFLERFDPNLPRCEWVPVQAGDRIEIGRQHIVEVGENAHIAHAARSDSGQTKSLDFLLMEQRKRLKPEFAHMSGDEIAALRVVRGNAFVTETYELRRFGYSGDTPGFDVARWAGTEVLAHEATFIAPDTGDRGHSELSSVIAAACEADLKALILGHFSDRYKPEKINAEITKYCEQYGLSCPVYALLPRTAATDLLAQLPVWSGATG